MTCRPAAGSTPQAQPAQRQGRECTSRPPPRAARPWRPSRPPPHCTAAPLPAASTTVTLPLASRLEGFASVASQQGASCVLQLDCTAAFWSKHQHSGAACIRGQHLPLSCFEHGRTEQRQLQLHAFLLLCTALRGNCCIDDRRVKAVPSRYRQVPLKDAAPEISLCGGTRTARERC